MLTVTKGQSSRGTLMFDEAAESGDAVRRQLSENVDQIARIGARLRDRPPVAAVTVGRGSSDHAAVFAKYLLETRQGVLTSPSGLSVTSLYKSSLRLDNTLCIAVSQSGKSPDLVSAVKGMRQSGAFVVALVNAEDSPLTENADETIPLRAGPEISVAATKSYITALSTIAQLIAHWGQEQQLLQEIEKLPDQLNTAWELDWSAASDAFASETSMFVLGRGLGYGLAREAALKFKETCSLHAEAYSAAEVLHGPAALIAEGFPILAFMQNDETSRSTSDTLLSLAARGANVFTAGLSDPLVTELPTLKAHPVLQPILMAQSFYKMVNTTALARGRDPDRPPNLAKITETV